MTNTAVLSLPQWSHFLYARTLHEDYRLLALPRGLRVRIQASDAIDDIPLRLARARVDDWATCPPGDIEWALLSDTFCGEAMVVVVAYGQISTLLGQTVRHMSMDHVGRDITAYCGFMLPLSQFNAEFCRDEIALQFLHDPTAPFKNHIACLERHWLRRACHWREIEDSTNEPLGDVPMLPLPETIGPELLSEFRRGIGAAAVGSAVAVRWSRAHGMTSASFSKPPLTFMADQDQRTRELAEPEIDRSSPRVKQAPKKSEPDPSRLGLVTGGLLLFGIALWFVPPIAATCLVVAPLGGVCWLAAHRCSNQAKREHGNVAGTKESREESNNASARREERPVTAATVHATTTSAKRVRVNI